MYLAPRVRPEFEDKVKTGRLTAAEGDGRLDRTPAIDPAALCERDSEHLFTLQVQNDTESGCHPAQL